MHGPHGLMVAINVYICIYISSNVHITCIRTHDMHGHLLAVALFMICQGTCMPCYLHSSFSTRYKLLHACAVVLQFANTQEVMCIEMSL